MAAVALTAAKIAPAQTTFEKSTAIAGVAITAGQPIHLASTGKWALANSASAGNAVNVHIALSSVGAGQSLEGLRRGYLAGFTLTGLAYEAVVYLADDSTYGTTAGTVNTPIGIVGTSTDGNLTKVLFVRGAV